MISDMLDEFERQDGVELFPGGGEGIDIGYPIIDREACGLGVSLGGADRGGTGVDAGDRETKPRHRFGDEATAAADIGKAEIVERPQRTRIAAKMREQSPTDEIDARGVY